MTRLTLVINLVCKGVALVLLGLNRWLAVAFFVGPDLYLLYHMLVPSGQGLGRVHTHFETEGREVWLTIDDGPDEKDTPRILDLLDRHRARATFFVVGARAARHPELVAEIVRRGNEVAHHTQSHPVGTFWCASPSRVRRELDECLAVLAGIGIRPRWFRAPVGIKNLCLREALRQRGLIYVGWSARGYDCLSRDPERVAARLLKRVEAGAILLMHEGLSVDARVRVEALSRLLDGLEARNLACVLPTAGQLR
jgi:peptidoglycan/xylan/chitin deacetylase (PgdA/CDA1 family)